MPKNLDKIKNITYASFYNNNTSFSKDQKNRIFSDRVYNRSYKTILNDDNNENKYGNNNEILDQQILDYLNRNNEEKKNLIKKMKNQKIFYNKIRDEKYMLNMNEIGNNINDKKQQLPPVNKFKWNYHKLKLNKNNAIGHTDQKHEEMMKLYKELEYKKKNRFVI